MRPQVEQLLKPELLRPLRANYLLLYEEAYLITDRPVKEVPTHDALPQLITAMTEHVAAFVRGPLADPTTSWNDDEEALAEAAFVCDGVVPTMGTFYRLHYSNACDEEVTKLSKTFADTLAALVTESIGLEAYIDVSGTREVLTAMRTKNVGPDDEAGELPGGSDSQRGLDLGSGKHDLASLAAAGGAAALTGTAAAAAEQAAEQMAAPQEKLLEFVEEFSRTMDAEGEFDGLVAVFIEDIDGAKQEAASGGGPRKRRLDPRGAGRASGGRGSSGAGRMRQWQPTAPHRPLAPCAWSPS